MTDSRIIQGDVMDADTVPFSLTCVSCDCGEDIQCETEAVLKGWTHLTFDPDGLAWTWVGLCPECRDDNAAPLFEET